MCWAPMSVPRWFAVGNTAMLGLSVAKPWYGVAVRTYVRSLAGTQKEALVVSSTTDLAWRLISDEGPYLSGHEEAPFPLAFMAAGMVASYYTEATVLAAKREVDLGGLELRLDSYYTMEGSALRGDNYRRRAPPQLRVHAPGAAGRRSCSACSSMQWLPHPWRGCCAASTSAGSRSPATASRWHRAEWRRWAGLRVEPRFPQGAGGSVAVAARLHRSGFRHVATTRLSGQDEVAQPQVGHRQRHRHHGHDQSVLGELPEANARAGAFGQPEHHHVRRCAHRGRVTT
jgi:hypothetical protein